MDVSKLSDADLEAIAAGDMSRVSNDGLQMIVGQRQTQQPSQPKDPFEGIPWQLRAFKDLAGGALRGAGSIGATLLAPIDIAKDAIGGRGLSLESNRQRRADITSGLQNLGFDTDATAFTVGKLGGEIAGTAGVGPAMAGGARAAGAAPSFVNALRTAGMTTGASPVGMGAKAADLGMRAAAGGAVGMGAGTLVSPDQGLMSAGIGAALPVATKAAGVAGNAAGRLFAGPTPEQATLDAARTALQAGYVIPPTQVNPSLTNRLLEGLSGKISMAQNASARNQPVTNAKAAMAVGLPTDMPITVDALAGVRKAAGNAYEAVSTTGTVSAGQAYDDALTSIIAPFKKAAQGFPNAKPNPIIDEIESLRTQAFDAGSGVEKIKELRDLSDASFRSGDKGAARAYKAAAKAIEDAIDSHLVGIGAPTDLLRNYRDARQLIAKTYSVEKALNPTTGNIEAAKLAKALKDGKPLSGDLRDIAQVGQAFPKATQPVERMGSLPQLSPLDWALGGGMGIATQNPLALLALGARPAARSAGLSGPVQRGLLSPGGGTFLNPDLEALLYRSAPVLAADR